jgi:DNA-binding IclR family transcriptional regulator
MSRMDGTMSVGDLLDVAGMPRFDALRLLSALRRAQVVDMVPI